MLNIQQRRSFLVVNSLDQWRGRLSHYPRDPRDAEFLLLPDASRAALGRVSYSVITGFLTVCSMTLILTVCSSILVLNLSSCGNGHKSKIKRNVT